MEIFERKQDDVLVVKVVGRLDSNTYEVFGQKMIEFNNEKKIIIDFSELDYISSAGLRIILMNAKRMKKSDGQLRLCNIKEFIKEIFDIAGFSTILNIDDDLEASLAASRL